MAAMDFVSFHAERRNVISYIFPSEYLNIRKIETGIPHLWLAVLRVRRHAYTARGHNDVIVIVEGGQQCHYVLLV